MKSNKLYLYLALFILFSVGVTELLQQEFIFFMYGFKGAGEQAGNAFYEISKAYPGLSNNFGIISSLDCYVSSIFGMVMGFAVDKYNRKNILGAIVMLCSLASVATGSINSLAMLIAMRIALGMCQSGIMPATYSLVQDIFP